MNATQNSFQHLAHKPKQYHSTQSIPPHFTRKKKGSSTDTQKNRFGIKTAVTTAPPDTETPVVLSSRCKEPYRLTAWANSRSHTEHTDPRRNVCTRKSKRYDSVVFGAPTNAASSLTLLLIPGVTSLIPLQMNCYHHPTTGTAEDDHLALEVNSAIYTWWTILIYYSKYLVV